MTGSTLTFPLFERSFAWFRASFWLHSPTLLYMKKDQWRFLRFRQWEENREIYQHYCFILWLVNLVKSVLKVTSIIPGNDVCTTKEDPSEMTSEEQFLNNTLTALNFFETRLAPNSHVILVGLIDAGVNNWIKRSKSWFYYPQSSLLTLMPSWNQAN